MTKQRCQQAAAHWRPTPGFEDRTLAHVEKTLAKQNRGASSMRRILMAATAAAACVAVAVWAWSCPTSTSPPPSALAPASNTTTATTAAPASPVAYSSLGLPAATDYSDVEDGGNSLCVMAFTEPLLKDCPLAVKATVEAVHFNTYLRYTQTVVYTIRIDDVFLNKLETPLQEGDTLLVEQELFNSSLSDLLVGLQQGGQYLLPLYYVHDNTVSEYDVDTGGTVMAPRESPYALVYPFMPYIQAVPDGGYLFFYRAYTDEENASSVRGSYMGWQSLFTDDARPVTVDVENAEIDGLWLRSDAQQVEADFQAVLDTYCH